jgi:hypothetical protein
MVIRSLLREFRLLKDSTTQPEGFASSLSFGKTSTDSEENPFLILYYSIERRENEMNSGCDLTQLFDTPGLLKEHRIFYEHKVGMEGGECLAVV